MIRARKLDPREVDAARKRGRALRSEAFHAQARSAANGLRRAFRALSRALEPRKGRLSLLARGVRVGFF